MLKNENGSRRKGLRTAQTRGIPLGHGTQCAVGTRRRFDLTGHLRMSRMMLLACFVPVLAVGGFMGVLNSAWQYLLMLLGFSLIIFVHELGHFMVARWCSVKCEVFSIGIGHRLVGWKKGRGVTFGPEPDVLDPETGEDVTGTTGASGVGSLHDMPQTSVDPDNTPVRKAAVESHEVGETDYRISMLPLGGYVKMLGQDDMDATKVSEDPRSFNRRPIWQRMCIVSAGVVMNIIFAFVVFGIVFQHGVPFPPAIVGAVQYGSPADRAGFEVGDEILRINGQGPVPAGDAFLEFSDVVISSALASAGESIDYTVRHPGSLEEVHLKATPVKGDRGMLQIGLAPSPSLTIMKFDDEADGQSQKQLNELGKPYSELRSEETIISVKVGTKDVAISTFGELFRLVQESRGGPMELTFKGKDGSLRVSTFMPELGPRSGVELTAYPAIAGFYPRTKVMRVLDGPAKDKGVTAGKVVCRLDNTDYPTLVQMVSTLRKGNEVTLVLENSGSAAPATATSPAPDRTSYTITPKVTEKIAVIGVELGYELDNTLISGVDDSNPTLKGEQLPWNSRIVSVDGTAVKTWIDIYNLLSDKTRDMKPGSVALNVVFEIARPGSEKTRMVTVRLPAPLAPADSASQAGSAGTLPAAAGGTYVTDLRKMQFNLELPLETLKRTQIAKTTSAAAIMGFDHTRKFILQTYLTLRGLATGTISPNELHGALGMAKIGHDAQEQGGKIYLLYVLAVISVNLAVANFLPMPIVDGGLFLLLILEKIRGKPLPMKIQNGIQVVGLLFLGCVFLFVTYNDLKLFSWLKNLP